MLTNDPHSIMSVCTFLSEPAISYAACLTLPQNLSRLMTKPTERSVHPVKTQISLGIHPVWSESSQYARWVAEDPNCFFMWTPKTLIRLGRCPGWSDYLLSTHHFVGFVIWWHICNELGHIKTYNQGRPRSASASMQYDQSTLGTLWVTQSFIMQSAFNKSLIRVCGCVRWPETVWHTCCFVRFVTLWLKFYLTFHPKPQ